MRPASAEVKDTLVSGDYASCEELSARIESEPPDDFFDFHGGEEGGRGSVNDAAAAEGFVMHDVSGQSRRPQSVRMTSGASNSGKQNVLPSATPRISTRVPVLAPKSAEKMK